MSEENKSEDKTLYELGFNIIPTVSEDKVSGEVDLIKKILADNNAEIVKEGEVQAIDLKYTMVKKIATVNKKFDKAYFGWIKFNATPSEIGAIKDGVDAVESILRYLLAKTVDDDEHSTVKIPLESEEGEEGEKEGEEKKDKKVEEK